MTANDVALAARVVVALILVVSGVGKLLGVRQAAHGYRQQFGRYAWVALAVALALPAYELVLAVLLLVVDAAWPSYLALATFVVFTVVLVRRMVKNDRRPCNCFGSASSKRNLSIGSLLRNTWFLVLAIVATGAATMQEPSAVFATLLVGVAFRRRFGRAGRAHVNVVVLVGTDATALGEAARELDSDTTRAAVFVGDITTPDGRAALHEFVTELFDHPR